MSVQGDIETAILAKVATAITGVATYSGPQVRAKIEGDLPAAWTWVVAGAGDRLEWGQTEWTEVYGLQIAWHASTSRAQRITDWETFTALLRADPDLGGAITGLLEAWASETDWGEAHDSEVPTMTASITVTRID